MAHAGRGPVRLAGQLAGVMAATALLGFLATPPAAPGAVSPSTRVMRPLALPASSAERGLVGVPEAQWPPGGAWQQWYSRPSHTLWVHVHGHLRMVSS